MKKTFILFGLIISSFALSQQNGISRIGLYKWSEETPMQPCDITGKPIMINDGKEKMEVVLSKINQQFRVIQIVEGSTAVIKILDYTIKAKDVDAKKKYDAISDFYVYNFNGTSDEYSKLSDNDANSRNYSKNQKYFSIGIEKLSEAAVKETKIKSALTTGVLNFPFKLRLQKGNSDFSGSFNMGAAIGFKFPRKSWRDWSFSIITGYSISNVMLDSSNANKNQSKLSSTNNFTAFSFSLGGLMEYQRVQAGFFIGWDKINKINQRQFEWQYQGKTWISIGFGYAIFSREKENSSKTNSDNPQESLLSK